MSKSTVLRMNLLKSSVKLLIIVLLLSLIYIGSVALEAKLEQASLHKVIELKGEYLFKKQVNQQSREQLRPTFMNCLFDDVTMVSLANADVESEDLILLNRFNSLEVVWLANTSIDDESIPYLISLVNLRELGIEDTNISEKGVQKLKKHLPHVEILEHHYNPLNY